MSFQLSVATYPSLFPSPLSVQKVKTVRTCTLEELQKTAVHKKIPAQRSYVTCVLCVLCVLCAFMCMELISVKA